MSTPWDPPRVLVTAGPTHEPIDAVRVVANRSSGRMGIALAEAAARRRMHTTLLLGPTALTAPTGPLIATLRFETAADLRSLLKEHWPRHDVLFMAAAVADYRPAAPQPGAKRRRTGDRWTLELEPTPDLVAELAASGRPDQVIVGFALEPADELMDSARRKLHRKGLTAIVANPLEAMGAEQSDAALLLRDGRILKPPPGDRTKKALAEWLLDQVATWHDAPPAR